jgi:hypothetical protein
MPAIGATASGEARLTEPIFIAGCYPTAYSLLALLFCRALRCEGFTIATTALVAVLLMAARATRDAN